MNSQFEQLVASSERLLKNPPPTAEPKTYPDDMERGSEAHNSFVLWAYGEQLLLRTGHYYLYGGPHHRDWVWSTRSLNNITVGGQGQVKRSASKGEIIAFQTTPSCRPSIRPGSPATA